MLYAADLELIEVLQWKPHIFFCFFDIRIFNNRAQHTFWNPVEILSHFGMK